MTKNAAKLRVSCLVCFLGVVLWALPGRAATPIFRVKALLDKAQVLLSGGATDGLEAGDVLFVHDNQRNLGRLTISRVTESEAYALITHELRPGAVEVGHHVEFEPIRDKPTDASPLPLRPGQALSSPVREAETVVLGARYSPSKLQEVDDRIRALKREINLGGEDARLYVELGEAYLLKNDVDTALNWLKQAVKLEQDGDYVARGLYRIAQGYVMSGRNDRAVRYLNFITANYPASPYNKTLNQTAREAREMFERYSLEQSLVEPETRLERGSPRPFATSGMRTFEVPASTSSTPAASSTSKEEEKTSEESVPTSSASEAPAEEKPTETTTAPTEEKPAAPAPRAAPKGDGEEVLSLLEMVASPGGFTGFGSLYATPVGVVRPGGQIKIGLAQAEDEEGNVNMDADGQFAAANVAVGDNIEVGAARWRIDGTRTTTVGAVTTKNTYDSDYTTLGLKYMGKARPGKARYGLAAAHRKININVINGPSGDATETAFYAFGRWTQDRSVIHGGLTWTDTDGNNDEDLGFFASYAALFGDNALGFLEFETNDNDDNLNVGLRYRMSKQFTLQAVAEDILDGAGSYLLSVDYDFGGAKGRQKLAESEGVENRGGGALENQSRDPRLSSGNTANKDSKDIITFNPSTDFSKIKWADVKIAPVVASDEIAVNLLYAKKNADIGVILGNIQNEVKAFVEKTGALPQLSRESNAYSLMLTKEGIVVPNEDSFDKVCREASNALVVQPVLHFYGQRAKENKWQVGPFGGQRKEIGTVMIELNVCRGGDSTVIYNSIVVRERDNPSNWWKAGGDKTSAQAINDGLMPLVQKVKGMTHLLDQ